MTSYRKIYEEANGCVLGDGIEIHHIDGNHANNDPSNLMAVTIEEHLDIHYRQRDWGAVHAILLRMAHNPEAIRDAASQAQKDRLNKGTHNFQKMTKERRSEISRKVGHKTAQLKIGLHAINADPVRAKENARQAGLKSAEKKAGFHDPAKSGSQYVKGTCWWTNTETGERKRCAAAPSDKWMRGMLKCR